MTTGAAANPTLTIVALPCDRPTTSKSNEGRGALDSSVQRLRVVSMPADGGQLTRISPSSDQPSCSTVWLTICGVSTR